MGLFLLLFLYLTKRVFYQDVIWHMEQMEYPWYKFT